MNLLNFVETFPDEASCKAKFKEYRDRRGDICPKCGHKEHYWKRDKESYECKSYGIRQGLRSQKVIHASYLPFHYWFMVIHLLTSTRFFFGSGTSASQLL